MSNMKFILYFNQDPLPQYSDFGIVNSTEICKSNDKGKCTEEYKRLETRIRFTSKYNIAACIIQKSMSTVLQGMICYLRNEKAFERQKRHINELSRDRFCLHKNEDNSMTHAMERIVSQSGVNKRKAERVMRQTKKIVVVREPVERFLSGFVDKCIRKPYTKNYCNGCKANMTCFILREYDRMLRQGQLTKLSRTFEDRHFFPQTWRCDFDKYPISTYEKVHYTTNTSELFNRFKIVLNNIPERSLQFLKNELTLPTVHTTKDSEAREYLEKRLLTSPYLMEYVVRMFYYDFVNLGYRVPEFQFKQKKV
ncbi:unnamed protein product [Bursaphelenchus okinawaensis]|uniref:Carbohydrate sulfotransferase n=1 Tax=Bursaphelenchus okinawaensis TaxID=465554 RepID=A0A811JV48_9BILA|nr:unnamed protein product [Bursaphelenchus okinawaensis]CAG9084658.1 unnamed protein product [Bursaphelenchus okinawaensis]